MPDLFARPPEQLVLRDYQEAALEAARENIRRAIDAKCPAAHRLRQDHHGAGPHAGSEGDASRPVFITDRTALLDQTSVERRVDQALRGGVTTGTRLRHLR